MRKAGIVAHTDIWGTREDSGVGLINYAESSEQEDERQEEGTWNWEQMFTPSTVSELCWAFQQLLSVASLQDF